MANIVGRGAAIRNHSSSLTHPNHAWPADFPKVDAAGSLGEYLLREGLRRPGDVAVTRAEESWTYRQLADRAAALALELADRGLKRGDVMVVESDPVPSALVVVLACWTIGAIYVPLTPETPVRRRDGIIAVTDPVALATDREARPSVATAIIVRIGQGEITVTGRAAHRMRRGAPGEAPPDSAYIIFTSGTTGTPKGITMSHRATTAFFHGMAQQTSVPSDARIGSVAPLSFDLSLLDWGLASAAGATLVQVPRLLLHHPRRFVRYLVQHEITMMSSVPSVWSPVLRHARDELAECTSLSTILLTGEPYPVDLVRALRQARPGLRVINCYGQSESIACSFLELEDPLPPDRAEVPIGPAHPGAELIVLNDRGQPAAPGEIGEAFLRSPALFSGYWRDQEATNRVMIPSAGEPDGHERVLRTGDLMRCEADGTLRFAGRADHQVKVNGNRVELEEVERVLGAHPSATEAVATVIRGASGEQLAAIVVAQTIDVRTAQDLRAACRTLLPAYMVPTHIVFVPSLPRTDGGKIDRRGAHQLVIDALITEARPDHPNKTPEGTDQQT